MADVSHPRQDEGRLFAGTNPKPRRLPAGHAHAAPAQAGRQSHHHDLGVLEGSCVHIGSDLPDHQDWFLKRLIRF
jgi:hypothetical protein